MIKQHKMIGVLLLAILSLFTMCKTKTESTSDASTEKATQEDDSLDLGSSGTFTFYYKVKMDGNQLPSNAKCYLQRTDVAGASRVEISTTQLDYPVTINATPVFPTTVVLSFIVVRSTDSTIYTFNDSIPSSGSAYFQRINLKYYRKPTNSSGILTDEITYPFPGVPTEVKQVVTWPPTY